MNKRLPTLNEFINEAYGNYSYVSPRKHETYIENEWTYEIVVKCFKDYFGIDLTDKDESVVFRSDIDSIVFHYGATHHQHGVMNIIYKILTANGHEVVNK